MKVRCLLDDDSLCTSLSSFAAERRDTATQHKADKIKDLEKAQRRAERQAKATQENDDLYDFNSNHSDVDHTEDTMVLTTHNGVVFSSQ